MKKTELQDQLCKLVLAARKGGCRMMEFLPRRATDVEISEWEAKIGMPFNALVREIVYICGHGLGPEIADRDIPFLEIAPPFTIASVKDAVFIMGSEKKPRWLIPNSRKLELPVEDYGVLPILTNFIDHVSIVWTAGDACSVIVRRNDYAAPQEHWQSPLEFIEYQTRCWEEGIYGLDASGFNIDWKGLERLRGGYKVKVVID